MIFFFKSPIHTDQHLMNPLPFDWCLIIKTGVLRLVSYYMVEEEESLPYWRKDNWKIYRLLDYYFIRKAKTQTAKSCVRFLGNRRGKFEPRREKPGDFGISTLSDINRPVQFQKK